MISQSTLDELRTRVRLADLIAESVALKQRGATLVGLCPFHNEKTPSFYVRDDDNRYHCFGCGASGDVVTYVMERQGLPFPDAVEYLAQLAGITIKYEGGAPEKARGPDRNIMYKATSLAQKFFHAQISKGPPELKEYLAQRSLTPEAIDEFGIGYSPSEWGALIEALRSKEISDELALSLGLARRSSRGELYDAFRSRLIFPIFIDGKRVAGFGGRVIPKLQSPEHRDSAPKYVNSPESAIYQKSSLLYGIPQALKSIRESREVYIVEGYTDVVSLWQAGVRNSVATCGTATTEQHVKRLDSMAKRVLLLFDGDRAGRGAAARAFQVFLNSKAEVQVLFLDEGDDPDSLATRHGSQVGAELRAIKPLSLLDCYIDSLVEQYGVSNSSELGAGAKSSIAEETATLLRKVEHKIAREEFAAEAAFRLMINKEDLLEIIDGKSVIPVQRTEPIIIEPQDPSRRVAIGDLPIVDRQFLLSVMVGKSQFTKRVLENPQICDELQPETCSFIQGFDQILENRANRSPDKIKEQIVGLLKEFGDSWIAHWRQAYAMLDDKGVSLERVFEECCQTVKRMRLQKAVAANEVLIRTTTDEAERIALISGTVELQRKIQALKASADK